MLDYLTQGYRVSDVFAKAFGPLFYKLCFPDDPIVRLFSRVQPYSITDIFRAKSVLDYMELSLRTNPGDVIECGTFEGGMSILMGLRLRELDFQNSKVHLCDTFGGLPNPTPGVDSHYQAGLFNISQQEVEATIESYRLKDSCVFHKGLFADTLPNISFPRGLAFAHIDGDLYASTVDCLKHVYPQLLPGGVLVLDDFYDQSGGVMLAVHEHITSTHEVVHLGPVGQAAIIKGMTKESADVPCFEAVISNPKGNNRTFVLSSARLQQMRPYVFFVAAVAKQLDDMSGMVEAFRCYEKLCRDGKT